MITTVCLNPAIDQSVESDNLQIGGVNRLRTVRSEIGGKGINVAIVLKRLGADVRCISCVGDVDAPFFVQSMKRESVPFDIIRVSGSVRRNLKIVQAGSHAVTELNEQGAEVTEESLAKLCDILSKQGEGSPYTALCGSLPPGCRQDTYQAIMRRLPGRRWVVDTSGAAMQHALREKLFLIKPNLAELEEIIGTRLTTPEAIQNAAVTLCQSGVMYTVISLGEQGAMMTDGKRTVFAPAVPVTATFTVGAGDAMLAGVLYGMDRGETAFDSLRYGVAAGAACVQGGSIHAFSEQSFADLLSKVETREL